MGFLKRPLVIASPFMTAISIVFRKNSMVFINRLLVFSLLLIISFVLTWLCLCPGVGMTQECGVSKTWNTGLFHEVGYIISGQRRRRGRKDSTREDESPVSCRCILEQIYQQSIDIAIENTRS